MDGPRFYSFHGMPSPPRHHRSGPWSYPQNAKAFPARRVLALAPGQISRAEAEQVVRPGPRARPARDHDSTSTSTYQPTGVAAWRVTRGGVGSGTAAALRRRGTWPPPSALRPPPRGPVASDAATEGKMYSTYHLLLDCLRHSVCCFPTAQITSLVLFQKFPELTRLFLQLNWEPAHSLVLAYIWQKQRKRPNVGKQGHPSPVVLHTSTGACNGALGEKNVKIYF